MIIAICKDFVKKLERVLLRSIRACLPQRGAMF